jgi:hypothetical protein
MAQGKRRIFWLRQDIAIGRTGMRRADDTRRWAMLYETAFEEPAQMARGRSLFDAFLNSHLVESYPAPAYQSIVSYSKPNANASRYL